MPAWGYCFWALVGVEVGVGVHGSRNFSGGTACSGQTHFWWPRAAAIVGAFN